MLASVPWWCILLLISFGCSDSTSPGRPPGGCGTTDLDSNLVSVFYWGEVDDARSFVVNSGYPASGVRTPQWVADGKILAATSTRIDNRAEDGVVQIEINKSTFEYMAHEFFEHSDVTHQLLWDERDSSVVLLDKPASSYPLVRRAVLANSSVVVRETVFGAEWRPIGISLWPGKPGVVAVVSEPSKHKWGVYWRYSSGGADVDSLIFTSPDFVPLGAGLAIDSDGRYAYVARADGQNVFTLLRLDLSAQPLQVQPLLSRDGQFICCEPRPGHPGVIALSYSVTGSTMDPPGDVIEILNSPYETGVFVQTRTHEILCRYPTNGLLSWSPIGRQISFPAGAFDSEGGSYISKLWITSGVP